MYQKTVVVAGHGCLDCQPLFPPDYSRGEQLFKQGTLTILGKTQFSLGGIIKVGPVLERLGIPTKTMGVYCDDQWGKILLKCLKDVNPKLAKSMILSRADSTSYSLVIQPPGKDRAFGHCPGPNDLFHPRLLNYKEIARNSLFLFGYLTLMRRMYQNKGKNARRMFECIKRGPTTTALEVTTIDDSSEAGQQDWRQILANVLPAVDIFIPSYREITQLLKIESGNGGDVKLAIQAAEILIDMGVAITGVKLGDLGCYVRVTDNQARLRQAGAALAADQIEQFRGQELFIPAWQVPVKNTCGAGDYWIAGFLATVLQRKTLAQAAIWGNTCGAYRITTDDPNRANPTVRILQSRLRKWSPIQALPASLRSWIVEANTGLQLPVYIGPNDLRFKK